MARVYHLGNCKCNKQAHIQPYIQNRKQRTKWQMIQLLKIQHMVMIVHTPYGSWIMHGLTGWKSPSSFNCALQFTGFKCFRSLHHTITPTQWCIETNSNTETMMQDCNWNKVLCGEVTCPHRWKLDTGISYIHLVNASEVVMEKTDGWIAAPLLGRGIIMNETIKLGHSHELHTNSKGLLTYIPLLKRWNHLRQFCHTAKCNYKETTDSLYMLITQWVIEYCELTNNWKLHALFQSMIISEC